MLNILDKSRSIAPLGYSRWLVPPAALAIHLCIGEAYGFSVFTKPLTQAIGIAAPATGDWSVAAVGWIFSLAIVSLGLSAAFFGKWVEREGPRKAMFVAACLFGAGFLVSSFGAGLHQLWLIYLGYGVIGGCGLGIGYISPVSTLIKWFPDRPGLATGTAIMGFGGGALIGGPLAVVLMKHYSSSASTGVAPTFLTMGLVYFCFMLIGVFLVRLPAAGFVPGGYVPPAEGSRKLVTTQNVLVGDAVRTPQFTLLWLVLCMNVTAGIGVLGQASLMIQEMFPAHFPHLTDVQLKWSAAAAAGFVSLLSIFNMLGRIFWASTSDYIGRKNTYFIFFALGIVLYALIPSFGHSGNLGLFVAGFCIILTMYGGGFATIPAYLRDVFGTVHVGAIHGRLLTAWSAAGVLGPVLINYMRQYQIDHGVAKADAYSVTMYIMAALLLVGLICNALMRPVDQRYHVPLAEAAAAA